MSNNLLGLVSEIMHRVAAKIRGQSAVIVTCSILLCTFLFIYYPQLADDVSIEFDISAYQVKCRLPKNFKNIEFGFRTETFIGVINEALSADTTRGWTEPGAIGKTVSQKIKKLTVENLIPPEQRKRHGDTDWVIVGIQFKPLLGELVLPLELIEVKLDEKKVELKTFFEKYLLGSEARYIGQRYVREFVSNLLLRYNDDLTNVLLAALMFACLSFSVPLIREVQYFYFHEKYWEHLKKKYGLCHDNTNKIRELQIRYGEDFLKKDSFFRLWQVLGPAFGFVMTISSLIAGLHPSLRATQSINMFFEAIQVAMVSTFVGLLLRIVATIRQHMNDKLFVKADELFATLCAIEEGNATTDIRNPNENSS